MGITEDKRPIGRLGHRWQDIIKMDLEEVVYRGMDLNDLTQVRNRWGEFVNAVMNFRVP